MKPTIEEKFAPTRADFFTTLNQRVNDYFKTNKISRYANLEMKIKTVCDVLVFSSFPYLLMITKCCNKSMAEMLVMCVVMGFGMAGIGLSVMHDANHGGYSNKAWVNNALGFVIEHHGGNAFNWKVQHNVLHHTYTNIHDVDEDISPRGILRMTPHGPWKSLHRFQHMYAWFFYGLLALVWVWCKRLCGVISRYHKDGMVKKQKADIRTRSGYLDCHKAYLHRIYLLIPLMLMSIAWWQWLSDL